MSTEHSSRSAIIISMIKGKIASFFGYMLAIPMIFTLISNPPPELGEVYPATEIKVTSLIFLAIAALLIYYGVKTKRRLKRFKRYISIITTENTASLEEIAGKTSKSVDFVMKDLQTMINKKYFVDAYIDENAHEIVLKKREHKAASVQIESSTFSEMVTVTCKGCGASNSVQKGSSCECEFCGSTLSA